MKTKYFILAAIAGMTFASCSNDEFIGDNSPTLGQEGDGSIQFAYKVANTTRADLQGAAAADALGNQFIVLGVKGNGTGTDQTTVFSNYVVQWSEGTAKTTESNTADWEYVGVAPISGITGVTTQTIKFWDYSTTAYDFAAFSAGKGNTIISSNPGTIPANQIVASPIVYNKTSPATIAGYTLQGDRADLAECYITDMKTVTKASNAYGNVVELQFRSLASKARMAIYETVPGYSVQNVRFYTSDAANDADINTDLSDDAYANATLFGADAFYTGGTYTISFPHIGSGNSGNIDYNKAHVAISGSTSTSTQSFGTLKYTDGKLGTASNSATFAGASTPYYETVLPNETGVVLEMRVNYELVSNDGSGEVIKVHGAKAFVPATYTKWLPNYAYTYIFKISDATNGWTSTDKTNPAGLYPITFDAVVLDPIVATNEQTTITTVAMPSITTYQKDHAASNNEYVAGEIYVQVMNGSTLATDLDSKSSLYSLSEAASEAEVMDALNLQASEAGGAAYITGRNGLKLTSVALIYNETSPDNKLYIPGEDGNNIIVDKGTAAKFSASATTYYAYVYEVSDADDTNETYPVVLTGGTAPDDWSVSDNVYYTDLACTSKANIAYVAGTYYRKYTNLNKTLGVKVIKVQ